MLSGAPTSTVGRDADQRLDALAQPPRELAAIGACACVRQHLAAHLDRVEMALARDHELVLPARAGRGASTISSICVGNRLTPRMISMSSVRPTILPMRRMQRAVGGSRRVRSRVR